MPHGGPELGELLVLVPEPAAAVQGPENMAHFTLGGGGGGEEATTGEEHQEAVKDIINTAMSG